MQTYILFGGLKKIHHLGLCKPHRLVFQTYVHLRLPILRLVYHDLIIRVHSLMN